MSKKISLLLYSLAPGGAERQVSILLHHLKDRFDITLVLMNDTVFYQIPKDIDIVYLDCSSPDESGLVKLLKLPILGWRYKRFLKKNRFDVSLSFLTRPNYINIFAKLFGSKTKTIISERSMFSHQYGYKNLQSFINNYLVYLYSFADLIVTNSKGNAEDLRKTYGIHKKIETIYNTIDLRKVQKTANERDIPKKHRFTFVTVGRLDEGKNHLLLIEAIQSLDTDLWIVGDGPLKNVLRQRIEELGLSKRVLLLGKQKNPYKYLLRGDCFAFASNHEGFPNVLLEAMACGLPVISTDCPSGPREILAPNSDFRQKAEEIELCEYGILVPVNDANTMKKAMQIMMEDTSLREKYRKKSIARVRDFDIHKIIKQWEDVLNERDI